MPLVVLLLQPRGERTTRQYEVSHGLAPTNMTDHYSILSPAICQHHSSYSPWHTLQKPAPEIGAIGLNLTPDYYGASSLFVPMQDF